MIPIVARQELSRAREMLERGDPAVKAEADALWTRAEGALSAGPWSITESGQTACSGDPHDYFSMGPYWWSDPEDPEGPWIRRDGERNPEAARRGRELMNEMSRAVRNLGAAWWFFRDERFAERAARVLRVWFLDPPTRMNPHMRYAQAIPGRCEGRGIGVIDANCLMGVVTGAAMLRNAPQWPDEDHEALSEWFRAFLDWLFTSGYGRDEAWHGNNHSTYYTAQVAAYALFLDDKPTAADMWERYRGYLIPYQMERDGSCPLELARTKSLAYSTGNLNGLALICEMAYQQGIDLYNWATADGRGLRRGMEFMMPFIEDPSRWQREQIEPYAPGWVPAVHLAALRLDVPEWRDYTQAQPPGSDCVVGPLRLTHPVR